MSTEEEDNPVVYVAGVSLRPDLKNLEVTSKSVEKLLEPLVIQVTTLVKCTDTVSKKRKGKSKKANVLVETLEVATQNFIARGEEIADETPEIKHEMNKAVTEVKDKGNMMSSSSRKFAQDPYSLEKRKEMVDSAKQLLFSVCRLLILADMVDVIQLIKSLSFVESSLEKLSSANNMAELRDHFNDYKGMISNLLSKATQRQNDLNDPKLRDELAGARATLIKSSDMLFTAAKAYIRHPEIAEAKSNRDFLLHEVREAMKTISDIAQAKPLTHKYIPVDSSGEMAELLQDFEDKLQINPLDYNEVTTRPDLEQCLENILSEAALLADSLYTRDDNKRKLFDSCNGVRNALQNLLTEFMENAGKEEPSKELDKALEEMNSNTKHLKKNVRAAVLDHVSDVFITTTNPMKHLVEAAYDGREDDVKLFSKILTDQTKEICEVAKLTSNISDDIEGVQMVKAIIEKINLLTPQVTNSAKVLVLRPKSKVTQENMELFKNAWEDQVTLLTEAVDDIITIDDFLAVSENHILDDIKRCCIAINDRDSEKLVEVSNSVIGRSERVCHMVEGEMDDYEPCLYTENVLQAVRMLKDQVMPEFLKETTKAVEMCDDETADLDDLEFINASVLLSEGVRDVRVAVLMTRKDDEFIQEEPPEIYPISNAKSTEALDEYPEVPGITTAREAMKNLPEEQKEKIAEVVQTFQQERIEFEKEVAKWDDSGNDIVMIAKNMCIIMMHMTDFTKGEGPLKTSRDVISAAQKISEAGVKLDSMAREIANQCPESRIKSDLNAFLDRIALYCHQLSITSKVKADVQNISGQLLVSGLDSATSLIQASKNLINAVVQVVKTTYVASKKYSKTSSMKPIIWKMKPPEKKPLVKIEKYQDVKSRVRRSSQKKPASAIKVLSEFQL